MTKPSRRGFGSFILLDSAKHFGQTVELDYAPRGLSYELQVQLNTIEASATRPVTGLIGSIFRLVE